MRNKEMEESQTVRNKKKKRETEKGEAIFSWMARSWRDGLSLQVLILLGVNYCKIMLSVTSSHLECDDD